VQNLYRRRIEIAQKIWSRLLQGYYKDRKELIRVVEREYKNAEIEPIRGRSKIKQYEKELTTLYLLGKYGLGLSPEEYSKVFDKFFRMEMLCEKAYRDILTGKQPSEVFHEIFGTTSEDIVFRVIRLAYIMVLLGFEGEETLIQLLDRINESLPELSERIKRFKKFYVALRIAEAIATRKVRNRLEKEALKHALCLRLKAEKSAPSDDEIRLIATEVYGLPEYLVNDVLKAKNIELALE